MAGHMGAMADQEASEHCLIRWQLPPMLAGGQFLLLVQMLRELRTLQQVRSRLLMLASLVTCIILYPLCSGPGLQESACCKRDRVHHKCRLQVCPMSR